MTSWTCRSPSGDSTAPTDESLAKVQRVLTKFNIDAQNLVCTTECDTVLEKLGAGLGLRRICQKPVKLLQGDVVADALGVDNSDRVAALVAGPR